MDSIPGLAVWAKHQSQNLALLKLKTLPRDSPIEVLEDRAVVFIEPRKHPSSEYVLRNYSYFLPSWKIIIVHGEENLDYVKSITETIHGKFEFLSCRLSNLSTQSYNTLLTHPAFWEKLPQYVLIAQTDTLLLQPAQHFLEDFILRGFEYCGAPWSYLCHRCKKPLEEQCGHMIDQAKIVELGDKMIGNGGLSFRSTTKMKEICSSIIFDAPLCKDILAKWGQLKKRVVQEGTTNEDVFYCSLLRKSRLPSRSEAVKFSIEQVPPESWDGFPPSMGAHKPWVYLPTPLVESILNKVKYE
jgi:hypothetical protein